MKPLFVMAIAATALFALVGAKCEATNYSEPQKQQPAPQPSEQPKPVTPSQ